jgi:hypothetical protein
MSEEESHELSIMYQERQRRIEEAIERAELGQATSEDFDIIRFECGLKQSPSPSKETSDALDNFFADSLLQLNNLLRK